MSSAASRVIALAEQLIEVVEDTLSDLDNMPFFVRPMVKRGFKKRTHRTMDEWINTGRSLLVRLRAGGPTITLAGALGGDSELTLDLAGLIENYRTAPRRAAKGMKNTAPATLQMLEQTMARREQAIRNLHETLHELPEG